MIPPRVVFESLLCPIDFSDCSAQALTTAAWMAEACGKPLFLLHAVHLDMPTYLTDEHKERVLEHWKEVRTEAQAQLEQWARPHIPAGLAVQFEISDAPPVEAIIAAAHRHVSWIVMGTHGRTGWRKVWMGSVTTRTIEQSQVPVLVIPPAGRE